MDRNGRAAFWTLLGLAACCLPAGGCTKGKDTADIISLEGSLEKITSRPDGTGEITVRFYSEKQKQEISGQALVTNQTAIVQNGAPAKLSDLKEGERIKGEVRVEKKNGERTHTAIRIQVDRPQAPSGG